MQDQAASAALSSSAHTKSQQNAHSILDEDGKLSSASAATSLKYAKPQDLPSFPSSGGLQRDSASAAAASLANNNKKSFEHWKPDPIPAANRAAMLAKDYSMDPLWHPEASKAGSKAAMLAASNTKSPEALQPKRAAASPSAAYDNAGNTQQKALMAATAVSHNRRRSGSLPTQPATKPSDASQWALKAATMSARDAPSARGNDPGSRTAHTTGHATGIDQPFASGDPGFEAARIQNVAKNNVDRQMYTSNPPVAIEVQEKNRQDTLRASAVAMAQKMYAVQQKHIDEAAAADIQRNDGLAAARARGTLSGSSGSAADDHSAPSAGYVNLEEAARKLAQERLAKIYDEHDEYRKYYGQTSPPPRSRLSVRSRRRASSAAATDDSDEEQSRRIRSQMSIFQSKVAEVDSKKRQQDRDNLLEIAHRNVDARIRSMDDKVFQETGKASPAQMEKWEKAAREKAQRDSDTRMQNVGKVHIGGGKYLDQSEVDAIARARLQPTLDDITEKAEAQRARDEEIRLERERKEAQAAAEKQRSAETAAQVKAATDKEKQEERARKEEEKRVQREEQNTEKERRKAEAAEEKERTRLEKEAKRKSKDGKPGRFSALLGRSTATPAAGATGTSGATVAATPIVTSTATEGPSTATDVPRQSGTFHDAVTSPDPASSASPESPKIEPAAAARLDTQVVPTTAERKSIDGRKSVENRSSLEDDREAASSQPKSRVKSWMAGRFRSKSTTQKDNEAMPTSTEADASKGKAPENDNQVPRVDSMRDVAMAGKTTTNETDDMYGPARVVSPDGTPATSNPYTRPRSPSISSLSSEYSQEANPVPKNTTSTATSTAPHDSEGETRGRQGLKQRLLKKIKPNKDKPKDGAAIAPVASNTTDDEFEEARDTFEEEKLAPPPSLSTVTGEGSRTKALSPKGSRDRSKFTEEL